MRDEERSYPFSGVIESEDCDGKGYGNAVPPALRELLNENAWWSENSNNQTHGVSGFKVNLLGLYDMIGNVWEWVEDIYGSYPNSSLDAPFENPQGA